MFEKSIFCVVAAVASFSDCGVSCPLVFEKSIFCVVATLAWIFFILAGNKDNYNISDEFEFRPDQTSDCGVSCPLVFEKSIFCIVATSAFYFDRIFFVLGSNKDNHNILDEFEFEPDLTLDCGVSCP